MGQRGPIKNSGRFRVLEGGKGADGADKLKDPPKKSLKSKKTSKTRPPVFEWLPLDAKRLLKQLIPELEREGLLSPLDGPGLAALSVHYVMLRRAVEAIEADGIRVTDDEHKAENGVPATRKHPLLAVVSTQSEKLKAWAIQYGMTSAARMRLLDDDQQQRKPAGGGKLAKYVD